MRKGDLGYCLGRPEFSQRLPLLPLGDKIVNQFTEARINLTCRPARIALSRGINVDPTLAVRSPKPAFDFRSPVFRLADVGLAVSLEAPAFAGAVFPGNSVDDDFDLLLPVGTTGTLDGEIHRSAATKIFGIRPIEEGDAEVELGWGVDYAIACHTTLLSLNK